VFPFGLPFTLRYIRDYAVSTISGDTVLTTRSLRCSINKHVAPFFYSAGRVTVFVASHAFSP